MRLGLSATLVPLLALLVACTASVDEPPPPTAHPQVAAPPEATEANPAMAAAETLLPAADPKLPGFDGWPLVFDVWPRNFTAHCRVALRRSGEPVATIEARVQEGRCRARWDGRDADGVWVPPGALEAVASIESASGTELAQTRVALEVVRLGIAELQLRGERVPLLYPKMNGELEGFYEVPAERSPWKLGPDAEEPPEATVLEHADGTPRSLPAIWTDTTTPPTDPGSDDGAEHDTYNLPTAWVAGAEPEIALTLTADVAGAPGGGEPASAELRLVAPEGTELRSEDPHFAHGRELLVAAGDSPVPAVGRYDWHLGWRFEVRGPAGDWRPIPGAIETAHRLYGLVGEPVLGFDDIPHRAWVDVVDKVTDWVGAETAEARAVAARVVEGVYFGLGLRYDDERGASHYTRYADGSWEAAVFSLSRFQDRAYGERVNCSDAASIVSTYASMVGVDLRYHILQHESEPGFDLNFIQAVGFHEFSETPFVSGRGGFRYHAVVGPADGSFFDATLALDGDGDPQSLPAAFLLARGMEEEDYLQALSSEWMSIATRFDEKVRLR